MFGGLLGHLAQASPSTAQRRRADIEEKQQAKLKLQAEEREEEKRKRKEELLAVRKKKQRVYDKQAVRIMTKFWEQEVDECIDADSTCESPEHGPFSEDEE
jgi:hypothetical protein